MSIARVRLGGVSLDETLTGVTTAACEALDWVDCASILVTGGSQGSEVVDTLGATDPLALKADALQCELGEGPGPEAAGGVAIVHADEVGADPRWPAYGRRAVELGIRAQTGAGLQGDGGLVGVLNLYSTRRQRLDDASTALVEMLAAQATTAIGFAKRVETLVDAMASRQHISQALGIVMERFQFDADRAWAHLVGASQARQTKLRVVARELIEEANQRSR